MVARSWNFWICSTVLSLFILLQSNDFVTVHKLVVTFGCVSGTSRGQYERLIPWEEVQDILHGRAPAGYTLEDAVTAYLHKARSKRSVEGGNCTASGGSDSCVTAGFAYTRCDPFRSICVCDLRQATKITVIPGLYSVCIPLNFVNQTVGFQCVPSLPDPCSLQVTASTCRPNLQTLRYSCQCSVGGTFPNCSPRLGSVCANTTVCTNRIPNSYCGPINPSTLTGACSCPQAGTNLDPGAALANPSATPSFATQTLVPSGDNTRCVPQTCPDGINNNVMPCNGDAGSFTCQTTPTGGWQCVCNAKGRGHNTTVSGICCSLNRFMCADFSACTDFGQVCDGKQDCNDCSDEKQNCQGAIPSNPVCAIGQPPRNADRDLSGSGRILRADVLDLDVMAPKIDRLLVSDSRLRKV